MTTSNKKQKGQAAENAACLYLQARGLKCLATNYRTFQGEIDLIMMDKDDIVFVEVRSRSRRDYGNALESVNQIKIQKLIKTAFHFLQENRLFDVINCRFDIIGIDKVNGNIQYEWVKNAFQVTGS